MRSGFVVLGLVIFGSSLWGQQNLLRNPGFESLAANGSPLFWTGTYLPNTILNVAEGRRAVALADITEPLAQTVPTTPGALYRLRFALRAPLWGSREWTGYSSGPRPIGPWRSYISVDGAYLTFFENDSMTNWFYFETNIVATGLRTTLAFSPQTRGGWPFFDDASFVEIPAPPGLSCAAPETGECGRATTLQATVTEIRGRPVTAVWRVDGVPRQTNNVPGGVTNTAAILLFTARFDAGVHTIELSASNEAAMDTCSTRITVVDTTPPEVFRISAVPDTLWPPNHRMIPVRIEISAADTCGTSECRIVSVESNERPRNSRDFDWQIVDNLRVNLRAARSGSQGQRIYTLGVKCFDPTGNFTLRYVTVTVPHDGDLRGAPWFSKRKTGGAP